MSIVKTIEVGFDHVVSNDSDERFASFRFFEKDWHHSARGTKFTLAALLGDDSGLVTSYPAYLGRRARLRPGLPTPAPQLAGLGGCRVNQYEKSNREPDTNW